MEPDSLVRANLLVDWAKSNGAILHEQVEVFVSKTYGTALRVKGNCSPDGLRAKTSVVSCPFKLSLSYLNAVDKFPDLQAHSILLPPGMFESLEPHIIGNFFLVQQYLTVNRSYWAPYIKSLPQPDEVGKINTPPYYSMEEMRWLHGTNLETETKNRIATWTLEWKKGISIINESQELKYLQGKWTFELYKWAATIFSSRSFVSKLIPQEILGKYSQPAAKRHDDGGQRNHIYYDPCPVLFPLVDIANHSPHAQVTWFSNAQGTNKNLSIIIESSVPAGNQIFNNYAPKSNTELLLGYGFTIPGNDEVAISFKPLNEDLMAIRRQQHCYHEFKLGTEKHTYHVRDKPYRFHSGLKTLPELGVFEEGCVDTLALLVSNQREEAFLKNEVQYCPEENTAASISGYMARNTFHIISVLNEKLRASLDEIINTGSDLIQPNTLAEKAAMIYRHGQIKILKHVTGLLEKTLDLSLSSHSLCGHKLTPNNLDGFEKAANVNLLSLECAFFWLKSTHTIIWAEAVAIILEELDIEPQDSEAGPLNYIDIVDGDWDFTIWCLWIFLVLSLNVEKPNTFRDNPVQLWIDQITSVYNPNGTGSFTQFSGDVDERVTLETMIGHLSSYSMDRNLLNLASIIVREESFPVDAQITIVDVSRRKQLVFCLSRLET